MGRKAPKPWQLLTACILGLFVGIVFIPAVNGEPTDIVIYPLVGAVVGTFVGLLSEAIERNRTNDQQP